MNRSATAPIVAIAAAAWAAGPAWSQCTNDAGAGDTAEGEVCAGDLYDDATNGGCNSSSPPAFTDVAADGGIPRTYCGIVSNYDGIRSCFDDGDCPDGNCQGGLCVGPSEPSANRRDTDWYLVSAPELAAADTDGNGTVRLTSAVTGEAGLDLVTFFITVDNLVDCNASVANNIGCWDSTGGSGQTVAEEVFTISEEPSGVIVFVAPGLCTGQGVFDGFECSTGLNDYTVTIATDAIFEDDPFTICGDPAQNPQLRPCSQANPGVNGCEDPACCAIVCTEFTPECCTNELGWIQQCADAALDLGCAHWIDGPLCLATGTDPSVDGYCSICADPYGSWSSDTFGGSGAGDLHWGDAFNPIGGLDLLEVSFTNGFYFFRRDGNGNGIARELLSNVIDWQNVFAPDGSIQRSILGQGILPFDDDNNAEYDRFESYFVVTGAGLNLEFHLTQTLDSGPNQEAVLTQTLLITNDHATQTADFTLVRSMDGDMVWDPAPGNDNVGTGGNGAAGCDHVWQDESGLPGTRVTIHSDPAVYFGAKAGVDPDGAGPGPPMGAGSDQQLWDAYGIPGTWENYIAGVGTGINGESGPAPPGCTPPCDGSIGLAIDVTDLGPGESTTVTVYTTYGPPIFCEVCFFDCGQQDGNIGIDDLLALLAEWGGPGSCDFDGGGVGIADFLALLAQWGPC